MDPKLFFRVEDLTKYDFHRTPLTKKKDDEIISVETRTLSQELTCPICLGIFQNTHTVMECMHRFCRECIDTSIRRGKKECPQCRVEVKTKRELRADKRMDNIIKIFYGDVNKYESEQFDVVEKLTNNMSENMKKSLIDGNEKQMKRREEMEKEMIKRQSIDSRMNIAIVARPLSKEQLLCIANSQNNSSITLDELPPLSYNMFWISHLSKIKVLRDYLRANISSLTNNNSTNDSNNNSNSNNIVNIDLWVPIFSDESNGIEETTTVTGPDGKKLKKLTGNMRVMDIYREWWKEKPREPVHLFYGPLSTPGDGYFDEDEIYTDSDEEVDSSSDESVSDQRPLKRSRK